MPNWCENDLIITGDTQQLRYFLDHGVDFNSAIPYPEQFASLDRIAEQWEKDHPEAPWGLGRPKDGFNQGGYEWCNANWGTKWNVSPESNQPKAVQPKRVKYSFSTAWAPPIPVILAWSKKYDALTFSLRYYEMGAAYQGKYVVKNGEVLEEFTKEYTGTRGG